MIRFISLIILLLAFTWSDPSFSARKPDIETKLDRSEVLKDLMSGNPDKSKSAIEWAMRLSPEADDPAIAEALTHALRIPTLVDYLWYHDKFQATLFSFFPELSRINEERLAQAIRREDWLIANMGIYFLLYGRSEESILPKISLTPQILEAMTAHLNKVIATQLSERPVVQKFSTIIPIINALALSPTISVENLNQIESLLTYFVNHYDYFPERMRTYILERLLNVLEISESRGVKLGWERVTRIYEVLKAKPRLTTRSIYDSLPYSAEWAHRMSKYYDTLNMSLEYVLQVKSMNPRDFSGVSDRERAMAAQTKLYQSLNFLEQSPLLYLAHASQLKEFITSENLGVEALISAPTLFRKLGLLLSWRDLYNLSLDYFHTTLDPAIKWGLKARTTPEQFLELTQGLTTINSSADLKSKLVDKLISQEPEKSPSASMEDLKSEITEAIEISIDKSLRALIRDYFGSPDISQEARHYATTVVLKAIKNPHDGYGFGTTILVETLAKTRSLKPNKMGPDQLTLIDQMIATSFKPTDAPPAKNLQMLAELKEWRESSNIFRALALKKSSDSIEPSSGQAGLLCTKAALQSPSNRNFFQNMFQWITR